MTLEPGVIITMVLAAVGGLIWLIRLEGRINLNEQRANDLGLDITEIKGDINAIKNDIKTLLRMNGKRFTDSD